MRTVDKHTLCGVKGLQRSDGCEITPSSNDMSQRRSSLAHIYLKDVFHVAGLAQIPGKSRTADAGKVLVVSENSRL